MSTRLCNSNALMLRYPINDRYGKSEIQKVKRALFGPVDHEQTKRFLDEEMAKLYTSVSQRWNFDFKTERTLSPDGRYVWRPMSPQADPPRGAKKRPSSDMEYDTSDLYASPTILRPSPIRPQNSPAKTNRVTQQRLITDFMPIKKNNSDMGKKHLRPAKIARLGDFAS